MTSLIKMKAWNEISSGLFCPAALLPGYNFYNFSPLFLLTQVSYTSPTSALKQRNSDINVNATTII